MFLDIFAGIFNQLKNFWEDEPTQKAVSLILVFTFLIALAAIELNRQGLIPNPIDTKCHKIPEIRFEDQQLTSFLQREG
jgi:hypothetical protein